MMEANIFFIFYFYHVADEDIKNTLEMFICLK